MRPGGERRVRFSVPLSPPSFLFGRFLTLKSLLQKGYSARVRMDPKPGGPWAAFNVSPWAFPACWLWSCPERGSTAVHNSDSQRWMGEFFSKYITLQHFVHFLNGASSRTCFWNVHGFFPLKCFPLALRHPQNLPRAFPLKYTLRFCKLFF